MQQRRLDELQVSAIAQKEALVGRVFAESEVAAGTRCAAPQMQLLGR